VDAAAGGPAGRSLAQLRRAAEQAFAEGRLYEDADAAIPLWLAVQEEDPDDRQARQGLQRARQRLQQQADALLVRPLKQREALAEASRQALVLLTLAPKDEKVRALQGGWSWRSAWWPTTVPARRTCARTGSVRMATARSATSVRRWRWMNTTAGHGRAWRRPRAA
jgi:hypothetical protein